MANDEVITSLRIRDEVLMVVTKASGVRANGSRRWNDDDYLTPSYVSGRVERIAIYQLKMPDAVANRVFVEDFSGVCYYWGGWS